MEYISWFLLDFIVIFMFYYFIYVRKGRKNKKKPSEVSYLITYYKLDTNLFSYRKFLTVVGLVVSFDIAVVATFVPIIDGIVWQILFGFIIIIPVVVLSFILVGNYYKKKQTLDNSKELEKEKKRDKKINIKKKGSKKDVK